MTTIRIELDDATYERIRQLAQATGRTVEEIAAQALTDRAAQPAAKDPFFGWLADEPDLADAIDEAATRARQERYGKPDTGNDR